MKLFLVVFYAGDGALDVGWIVSQSDAVAAAITAEHQHREFGERHSSQRFASTVIEIGHHTLHPAGTVVMGPVYGDFYNRQLCKSWVRDSFDGGWECLVI